MEGCCVDDPYCNSVNKKLQEIDECHKEWRDYVWWVCILYHMTSHDASIHTCVAS